MQRLSSIQQELIKQFTQAKIEKDKSFFVHPSYQLEQELLHWVRNANLTKANQILNEINKLDRATLAYEPLRSLKNSLICLCTLLTRETIKAGVAPETAYDLSDVLIRHIEKVSDKKMLHQVEYEMVQTFIQSIIDYGQKPFQNEIIDRSIEYIQQNLFQPLTLESIAEEIQVSPNYLSTLFRKKVGVSIKEYINRKKIEESKYFLLHTGATLLDISLLLGYCNQSYYTSLFKKYIGITPKQFKRNSNAKNSA
ncbi:AraC family transcriptional regulator [Bacillus sp. BGMRC 2118]|nr:AraC family transcriptional regulator [Bacillus sp. BGMRC 2118]